MPEFLQKIISDVHNKPQRNLQSKFTFNSYFESGNIDKVFKRTENEFDLLMKTDTNSLGYAQWFYFEVTSSVTGDLKMNILNFSKRKSLFRKGMRPCYRIAGNKDWNHVDNTQYEGHDLENGKRFYTLSFVYKFLEANEKVFFSFAMPYTFTRLKNFLFKFEDKLGVGTEEEFKIEKPKLIYRRNTLCKSLGGLPIYILTITSDKNSGLPYNKRKGVVITSRVHPGETTCSYIAESLIKFLLDNHQHSIALRNLFVFKIIPMLNPDGVVCGNYRTSLAGVDLNRQ